MGSNVLTSLIQDAILKLCTQHVTFDASLEIDGIICITPGQDAKEIVVKMHRTIMKPVTQPDQYAPEMDTNPSTPSSTSSATPHKRQRNRQGRDIDPNAYPQNVTSNVSFDEMPKPSIYDEDSGGGGYYSSEQQQQYATPDSTPSKSRKRRAAPAPEASTEEKYIKVEPGESEILVEEPTSVTPGNSNDGYTDPNQGFSMTGQIDTPQSAAWAHNDQSLNKQSRPWPQMGQSLDPTTSATHGSTSKDDMFIEDPSTFSCSKCNIEFPSKSCSEYHHSIVHNKYCDVCQKRLDDEPEEGLIHHGSIHADVKPFQCDLCYKLFASKTGLKLHKVKFQQCILCHKMVHIVDRGKHLRSHHAY